MKSILFIVNNGKISPNENGGASVYFSHLEMLFKASFNITILAVQWVEEDVFRKEDFLEIENFVTSIIPYKATTKPSKKKIKRIFNAIFKPQEFEYHFLNKVNKNNLHKIVQKNNIDLVWAEWRWAGIWSCFSELKVPVIYAHHDWEFKLAKLRSKRNLLQKFHTFQKKRIDFKLVKKANGCVSGSNTETEEIKKNSRKKALYLPTTYKEITILKKKNETPNIIHLGGMGTTANRLGLERFLDISWHKIKNENPDIQLIVIGSLEQAQQTLLDKLKDKRIICLGFVENLFDVLFPNDIHIIPWEYNTGTRTRLPLILNYKQVLVATKNSVKAFPELEHKKNAVLCDNLSAMAKEICILCNDLETVNYLAENAKNTFSKYFTSEQNFLKLKKYIDNLLEKK